MGVEVIECLTDMKKHLRPASLIGNDKAILPSSGKALHPPPLAQMQIGVNRAASPPTRLGIEVRVGALISTRAGIRGSIAPPNPQVSRIRGGLPFAGDNQVKLKLGFYLM